MLSELNNWIYGVIGTKTHRAVSRTAIITMTLRFAVCLFIISIMLKSIAHYITTTEKMSNTLQLAFWGIDVSLS